MNSIGFGLACPRNLDLMPAWNGFNTVSNDHHADLDADTGKRLSIGEDHDTAKQGAYLKYKRDQHEKAAAYHLVAAKSLDYKGNKKDAERHRSLYKMHLSAAGHKDKYMPPTSVRIHLAQDHGLDFFKSHPADGLVGG